MKKLPIYIAGASSELTRVRKWADAIEKSGTARVTLRWFDGAESWAGRDAHVPLDVHEAASANCLQAIREARLFWLLLPASVAGGAVIEYGFALGHHGRKGRIRTIVSGTNLRRTVFSARADETYELDVHAFQSVLRHATQRAAGVG